MTRYVLVMPQFLAPEQFTQSIADGAPTITLHGVTVSNTDGWSFLNRATLLVVDGPGEEGFLLPRLTSPDGDLAPAGLEHRRRINRVGAGVLASGVES